MQNYLYSVIKILLLLVVFMQIDIARSQMLDEPRIEHREGGERDKKERFLKIQGRINEELGLKDEIKDQFWAIHSRYRQKIKRLRDDHRDGHMKLKNNLDKLKDDEILAVINLEIEMRREKLNIEIEMNDAFLKVISPRQLLKLKAIEHHLRSSMEKHRPPPPEHPPR